jgi:hypothetical protein
MVATVSLQEENRRLENELAKARLENDKLKGIQTPWLKVSQKGALSVYGLGRFPVSLYKSQWLKLLSMTNEIQSFIAKNNDVLAEKKKD